MIRTLHFDAAAEIDTAARPLEAMGCIVTAYVTRAWLAGAGYRSAEEASRQTGHSVVLVEDCAPNGTISS